MALFTSESENYANAPGYALIALAKFDERKFRVIELRYFSGLSLEETAAALGLSIAALGYGTGFARS